MVVEVAEETRGIVWMAHVDHHGVHNLVVGRLLLCLDRMAPVVVVVQIDDRVESVVGLKVVVVASEDRWSDIFGPLEPCTVSVGWRHLGRRMDWPQRHKAMVVPC